MADHLTHEVEYRGKAIVEARASKRVVLFGVGALGSKLLNLLIPQGYTNLLVADMDRVDRANLGTQDYVPGDVGRMKATQSSSNAFKRFKVSVGAFDKEVTASNIGKLLSGADLALDLFDNAPSRQIVKDACASAGIPCLHAGMSGDGFAEIEWNENYTCRPSPIEDVDAPCDYPLAANLVAITVALTAEVINRFIDEGQKQSVQFTLKDLKVDVL